jgi:hypothetical protein
MRGIVYLAVAASVAAALGARPSAAADKKHCKLDNGIERVVYIQFDNVHFRRDNPNVPSDLEQMPNLLNFLEDQGTLFTNHHTPLISHTSVDMVTSLTGVYGDKFGVPIGNSFGLFDKNGIASSFPSSFTYWTDVLADGTPEMLAPNGKNAPAPWVPFTRHSCDVGAFSVPNIDFENVSSDINTVFAPIRRRPWRRLATTTRRSRISRASSSIARREALSARRTARPTSSRTSPAAITGSPPSTAT